MIVKIIIVLQFLSLSLCDNWPVVKEITDYFPLANTSHGHHTRSRRQPVNELVTGTWNMQGETGRNLGFSKYTLAVSGMMKAGGFEDRPSTRRPVDVLALQEAGTPPQEEISVELTNVIRIGPAEHVVRLNEQSVRGHFVYYTEVAQRVHMAIVSRIQAHDVILFPPFRDAGSARPPLGIRIQNAYFFTIHAASINDGDFGNRNEAPAIVNAIENYMVDHVIPNEPRATWIIMGDFNRTPFNIMRPTILQPVPAEISRNFIFLKTRKGEAIPTQHSGLPLDFAIVGGGLLADQQSLAALQATTFQRYLSYSDHDPLRFRLYV